MTRLALERLWIDVTDDDRRSVQSVNFWAVVLDRKVVGHDDVFELPAGTAAAGADVCMATSAQPVGLAPVDVIEVVSDLPSQDLKPFHGRMVSVDGGEGDDGDDGDDGVYEAVDPDGLAVRVHPRHTPDEPSRLLALHSWSPDPQASHRWWDNWLAADQPATWRFRSAPVAPSATRRRVRWGASLIDGDIADLVAAGATVTVAPHEGWSRWLVIGPDSCELLVSDPSRATDD
jgi:hypothetical protein